MKKWDLLYISGIFSHSMQRSRIDNYIQDGGEELFTKIHCIPSLLAPQNNGILSLYKQAPFVTSEKNWY